MDYVTDIQWAMDTPTEIIITGSATITGMVILIRGTTIIRSKEENRYPD
jgi:hypothetical protein